MNKPSYDVLAKFHKHLHLADAKAFHEKGITRRGVYSGSYLYCMEIGAVKMFLPTILDPTKSLTPYEVEYISVKPILLIHLCDFMKENVLDDIEEGWSTWSAQ